MYVSFYHRTLESIDAPINDSDVTILICDSNVEHELTSSDYTPRQRQCQAAENILGVGSLRDVTLGMLNGIQFIHIHFFVIHRFRV